MKTNEVVEYYCSNCLENKQGKCTFSKECSYKTTWDWERGGWVPIAADDKEALEKHEKQLEEARLKLFKKSSKKSSKKTKKQQEGEEK